MKTTQTELTAAKIRYDFMPLMHLAPSRFRIIRDTAAEEYRRDWYALQEAADYAFNY